MSPNEDALYSVISGIQQPHLILINSRFARLEDTLDNSGEKTLDMSSILLDPSPPPAPHPPAQTVTVADQHETGE